MLQTDDCGYKTTDGKLVIPEGKYPACFTDTLKRMAIVADPEYGLVAIDRDENLLFQVFSYDNRPDPVSEGLFRIIKDEKIGFANPEGKIVIPPQFDCAYPFEKGQARVALNCEKVSDGEHTSWQSEEWYSIDHFGKRIQ